MGQREQSIEYLTFINHTECHCISRHNNRHPQIHSTIKPNNTATATAEINNCQCVKHYKVFYERVESSDEDDEVPKSKQSCRCDCESDNASSCDWLKKGKDGFSIEDRWCIRDNRCLRPVCEYGQYNMQNGRCPKLEDKLAGARNLSFD